MVKWASGFSCYKKEQNLDPTMTIRNEGYMCKNCNAINNEKAGWYNELSGSGAPIEKFLDRIEQMSYHHITEHKF